mgnify:FL=1
MTRQNSKRSRNSVDSKHNTLGRYLDSDGGYAGSDGSSSEEEITIVHESDKQRVKRKARAVKTRVQEAVHKPNFRTLCWRYFLFFVVVILGVAMIIQLYSSYGEFLTDQIFPPRVSSGGVACGNGTVTRNYMLGFDKYVITDNSTTEGWLHLNATRPGDSIEWAWRVAVTPQGPRGPQEPPGKQHAAVELLDARWKDKEKLQVWLPSQKECARVLVFSV